MLASRPGAKSGTTAQGVQGDIIRDSGVRGTTSKSDVRGAILTASGAHGVSSKPGAGVHGERKPKSSVFCDGSVHCESSQKASMADGIVERTH